MRLILVSVFSFIAGCAATFGLLTGTFALPSSSAVAVAVPNVPQEPTPVSFSGSGREVLVTDDRGQVKTFVEIDGRDMEVLVDTGASAVVLRESDARRAGYRLSSSEFSYEAQTANGTGYFAPVLLREIEIGSIRVRNVRAFVARDEDLWMNLLGMTFLRELESFRFEGRELILEN